MKILLVGAGLMGSAVARDLLTDKKLVQLIVVDKQKSLLEKISGGAKKDSRLKTHVVDLGNLACLSGYMKASDTVVSAVPYYFNVDLTRMAIENRCHFCDLGGNNTVVDKQHEMGEKAKSAGVAIVPDCGLAPGLASIVASLAKSQFDSLEELYIRVGGLPQKPTGPLNYALVFSVNGLINEYKEPTVVIDRGKLAKRESLTEIEVLTFPRPFGTLEAFNTSGGLSTLPRTFGAGLRTMNYKTIRFPGHCEKMKVLFDLGFFDEKEIHAGGHEFMPRPYSQAILEHSLGQTSLDSVLFRLDCRGKIKGKKVGLRYQFIDNADSKTGFTAMMRTTAFPIAAIARLLSTGIVADRGTLFQELSIPHGPFFELLAERGIRLRRSRLA